MSITFYLISDKPGELKEHYPDEEVAFDILYPSFNESFYDYSDTDMVLAGHFFTHDKGWIVLRENIPEVNMSNSNAHYVLNQVLLLNTTEYCGDIEDLQRARTSCMLRTKPSCYWGIPALKDLLTLAIDNGWGVYWA